MSYISYTVEPVRGYPTKNLYTHSSVEKFAEDLCNTTHYRVEIDEGSCGIGTFLLIPYDTETYYCFIVQEVALNCWSSAQKVRKVRFQNIGKRWWDAAAKRSEELLNIMMEG